MNLYVIMRRNGWATVEDLQVRGRAFRGGRRPAGLRGPLDPQLRPRRGGR